jgi:monoterpene epsilon-lactone hydrolase
MTERGIEAVRRHLAKLPPQEDMTFDELRAQYDRAERAFPIGPEVAVEHMHAGAVPAERLRPVGAGAGMVLYLHGGGYVIGSPRSHRHLAAAIATSSGASALLLDYRRAPEHPFPAAVDDAVAAYRWLLEVARVDPKSIAIAGDSAGGGLTVALLLALRDAGAPLPAAGICISPWVDLTCSLASYVTKAAVDPVVQPPLVAVMAKAYLGREDPRAPLASPLHAELRGLPPLLIQVGSEEVLLEDARELAARAKGAGVDVTLEVWDRMIHVWHWFLPMLDEAQAAIDRIGVFVSARVRAS